MKNLSIALAFVGLVGLGLASALVISNHLGGDEVTVQNVAEQPVLAQNTTEQVSQNSSSQSIPESVNIDTDMAYSLATFCHNYLDDGEAFDSDYTYTRRGEGQFSPPELSISLTMTCQDLISSFEAQIPAQVHYSQITKVPRN